MIKYRNIAILLMICCMLTACSLKLEDKEPSNSIELSDIDYEKVYFNVSEDIYYPVRIPDKLNYTTDNAKYIYADDNKLNISVISGVDYYNFSESALIKDAENVQKDLVVTKDWEKQEVDEAALYLFEDKAIRVHVEDNPEAFSVILAGLKKESTIKSKYDGLSFDEDDILEALPTVTRRIIVPTYGCFTAG